MPILPPRQPLPPVDRGSFSAVPIIQGVAGDGVLRNREGRVIVLPLRGDKQPNAAKQNGILGPQEDQQLDPITDKDWLHRRKV